MKNRYLKYKIVAFFSVCLCLGWIGHARADTSNTVLSNLITPNSPEDTTTIEQRLSQRKATYKSQLALTNNPSVAAKCELAQSPLIDVRTKTTKAAAVRLQAYNGLTKRLSFLVDNLSSQGIDPTELSNAQNTFVAAINTYLNDAENYKTALDDSITVDCKNDPSGFMASVLDARKWRAQLGPDVVAVKATQSTLRKALSDERQLLIKNPTAKKKS
jgi:hypothetical protein